MIFTICLSYRNYFLFFNLFYVVFDFMGKQLIKPIYWYVVLKRFIRRTSPAVLNGSLASAFWCKIILSYSHSLFHFTLLLMVEICRSLSVMKFGTYQVALTIIFKTLFWNFCIISRLEWEAFYIQVFCFVALVVISYHVILGVCSDVCPNTSHSLLVLVGSYLGWLKNIELLSL